MLLLLLHPAVAAATVAVLCLVVVVWEGKGLWPRVLMLLSRTSGLV